MIRCWGNDGFGNLGSGSPPPASGYIPDPVLVTGLGQASAFSAGGTEACAILHGGGIDCWRDNRYGLGDDTGGQVAIPARPPVAVTGFP